MLSELHIIGVLGSGLPKDQHQFVLRTIEATHPAAVLGPDAQIDEFAEYLLPRLEQKVKASPVDEQIDQRTGAKDRRERSAEPPEKVEKFGLAHLARGLDELPVLALRRDEAVYRATKWWIECLACAPKA